METNKDMDKVASLVARGDSYFLADETTVYYTRSVDEVRRMYEYDRRNGYTMGDAARPWRIHSRHCSVKLGADTSVVITRLNGAEWYGYSKKPARLVVATVITGPYIGQTVAVERRWLKTKM